MALPYEIPNPIVAISDALTAPPANTPLAGAVYLLPASCTGNWEAQDNNLAFFVGGDTTGFYPGDWKFIIPSVGTLVYVVSTGKVKSYTGSAWVAGLDTVDKLGDLSDTPAAPSANNFIAYDTGTSAYKNTTGLVYDSASSTLTVKNWTAASSSVVDNGANRVTNIAKGTASGDALQKGQIASTSASEGASLVGLQDSAGNYAATEVEAALAEIATLSLIRPFTHTAYRSGSFTDGQRIRLFLNTTDNDANFVIPAGQTLKVLAAYGRCKSGSGVGTTWTLGITSWEDQAHAGANNHDLATGTTEATSVFINIAATGTLASPLATIVGDDDPVAMCFIEHDNDAGRASSSDKHTIMVYGVFVDD